MVTSDFTVNYLKKVIGGATFHKNFKRNTKTLIYFIYGCAPRDPRGVKRSAIIHLTRHWKFDVLTLTPNLRKFEKNFKKQAFLTFLSLSKIGHYFCMPLYVPMSSSVAFWAQTQNLMTYLSLTEAGTMWSLPDALMVDNSF